MISFVIPTLNEEKSIEKILQNLSQYKGPCEIIVSDGGSNDRTVEIAKKYTEKILVNDRSIHRQTISEGRNVGGNIATGDYIVFLDADTYIQNPDQFFHIAEKFFANDPRLVGLAVKLRILPGLATPGIRFLFALLNIFNAIINNIFHIGGAPGDFQMVRKSAFQKLHGFDEKIVASEDYEFFRRLSKIGRTHYSGSLSVYHTGRRAHSVGWIKLLWIWLLNGTSVLFRKKAVSKEWKVIR